MKLGKEKKRLKTKKIEKIMIYKMIKNSKENEKKGIINRKNE